MVPDVVTAELVLSLVIPGDSVWPVDARVSYSAADPYAVSLTFMTSDEPGEGICWTFARQLLTDGITRSVGDGDVQVHPRSIADPEASVDADVEGPRSVVVLSMSSPNGSATFEASMHDVVEFLADTYAVVPTGTESAHVDVDAAIAAILGR